MYQTETRASVLLATTITKRYTHSLTPTFRYNEPLSQPQDVSGNPLQNNEMESGTHSASVVGNRNRSRIMSHTATKTPPTQSRPDRQHRFDKLVTVYLNDLYRYAWWLTRDKAATDDIVQDTLLRAWKSLDKLQNPKAAKGWLLTILRRENARRFERIQPQLSSLPLEILEEKHQDYDTSTEAFVLRNALEKLPADYREPLVMQVLWGYSQKEVARELGISEAGAGTRLFRARKRLRALLEEKSLGAAA